MDPFEKYLSTPLDTPPGVSLDDLKIAARRASKAFLDNGIPMNTTISDLRKESSLSDEHLKRVVEYANTDTFRALFSREFDRNVSFPVADFSVIKGDTKMVKTSAPVTPDAWFPSRDSCSLKDLFGECSEVEKTAAPKVSRRDFILAVDELQYANASLESAAADFVSALDATKEACVSASREGAETDSIWLLVKSAGVERGTAEVLYNYMGSLPVKHMVGVGDVVVKSASAEPNKDHPIFKAASALRASVDIVLDMATKQAELEDRLSTIKAAFGAK
jgi:hypothetical protein